MAKVHGYDKEKTFFLVIFGSRDFDDYDLLEQKVDKITQILTKRIVVVSGTANGADKLGEKYAKKRGYPVLRFPADWNRYGKRAGMIRNRQMAEIANGAIGFWDGQSRGTKGMIEICKELGVQLRVIQY